MSHVSRVPELPGTPVARHSEQEIWLKRHVARLCQLDHDRYSYLCAASGDHYGRLSSLDFQGVNPLASECET